MYCAVILLNIFNHSDWNTGPGLMSKNRSSPASDSFYKVELIIEINPDFK